MYRIQKSLSLSQTFPVQGSLIVSPCKAVISVAQIVEGFAQVFINGLVLIPLGMGLGSTHEVTSCLNSFDGGLLNIFWVTVSLVYSIINFHTIVIVRFVVETLQ